MKVLSATFRKQNALKVGEVEGAFDVTSIDPGPVPILRSAQKVKLPYSIDYSVDLSGMSADRYRWDKDSRTLGRRGARRDRRAAQYRRGAAPDAGDAGAVRDARRGRQSQPPRGGAGQSRRAPPRRPSRSISNARAPMRGAVIADMLETPLELAGMGEVKVVVRLPQDARAERRAVGRQPVDRRSACRTGLKPRKGSTYLDSGAIHDRANPTASRGSTCSPRSAPQEGAQRGHPGALLPEARNPGPGRFRRRQPRSVAQGGGDRRRRDRVLRGALHGRDGEDLVAAKRSSSCPTWTPAAAWRTAARPTSSRRSARRIPTISR